MTAAHRAKHRRRTLQGMACAASLGLALALAVPAQEPPAPAPESAQIGENQAERGERQRDGRWHRPPGSEWGERNSGPPTFDLPTLTTVPDGVFNRLHAEMQARHARHRELAIRIEQESRVLDEMRRRGQSGHPTDMAEVRDRLAVLHGAVDDLVRESEQTRTFIEHEVAPHLSTMIAELDQELEATSQEDPRRPALERVRAFMRIWAESPAEMMTLFDQGPAGGGWRMQRLSERLAEGGPTTARRFSRRIERLEEQQERLREQIDSLQMEIGRLRALADSLPPEALERLDEALEEHPGRGPRRPPGPPPHAQSVR